MEIKNIDLKTLHSKDFKKILSDFSNSYVIFEEQDNLVCQLLLKTENIHTLNVKSIIPRVTNHSLGNRHFCDLFSVNMPIMSGSMANEIASTDLVINMAKNGLLACYGTAGISLDRMEKGIDKIKGQIGESPFACCLIHHPLDLAYEEKIVDLFFNSGINVIEASAFMQITPAIVLYRAKGLIEENGRIHKKNRIIAKVSRLEIAEKFLIPPNKKILQSLLSKKLITQIQFELSQKVSLCDAVTVEADSGGHTDNRPAQVIIPAIINLRQRLCREAHFDGNLPLIGQAGGISSPSSILSAFF